MMTALPLQHTAAGLPLVLLTLTSPDDCDANSGSLVAQLMQVARSQGWIVERLTADGDARFLPDADRLAEQVTVVFLGAAACANPRCYAGLRQHFPHALLVGETACAELDLQLPQASSAFPIRQLLLHAADHRARGRRIHELVREVGVSRQRTAQLLELGNALTAIQDLDPLLRTILGEARRLASCDAASLYLLDDRNSDEPSLIFKLAQNDSIDVSIEERRLPLSAESIAGYVALSGKELNLADAYAIPSTAPYHFNRSFDESMGYRTRSMLVLPMRDHHGAVVGVLQFINCLNPSSGRVIAFSEETVTLLRAIASHAAVSIQKNLLIEDMSQLFESFVQAAVKAVEQRDPSTSGHSFRVAEKTVALLTALPASGNARFQRLDLKPERLKEVRYAALLHDFGKIGVRESVLVKARKLTNERLAIIEHRVELQRERLRRRALEEQLQRFHHGEEAAVVVADVEQTLARELTRVDELWEWVQQADEPAIELADRHSQLDQLQAFPFFEADGRVSKLLSPQDIEALSVQRGSLTLSERKEIQAHVTHTREFLDMLTWPPELSEVPDIAGAHHEKLDGSGYPLGLKDHEIPLPTKVMTICDIFDALTATDRPYKRSMTNEEALVILEKEAKAGLLDADMVKIFIDAGIYR